MNLFDWFFESISLIIILSVCAFYFLLIKYSRPEKKPKICQDCKYFKIIGNDYQCSRIAKRKIINLVSGTILEKAAHKNCDVSRKGLPTKYKCGKVGYHWEEKEQEYEPPKGGTGEVDIIDKDK